MTTFDKFRNYNTWPQNIPLEQAKGCWDQIKESELKNILGLYHVEWQKLYTVKFQVQTYVEDLFKQIVEVKQFNKKEFQQSQDYIKRMIDEISSISRNKQEIIDDFKKQNQNNFQELLSQWEINKILFEDVNILQNLNIKLKSDKNELISKYEEIQKHQSVLHQQIQEYQNLIPHLFSDYKNRDQQYSFDHIQASIKNVTNQSEALLELAREIIQRNQIPQNDSSAGLLNLFMKTLIYNNQFLMKVSQTLRNYWTQLIRIQEKNQALEREILSKTEEIAQIKILLDQNQKEFELYISAQEERMRKLQPQDYNSHDTKMQKIEKELMKIKQHYCQFGCNLFLRLLFDLQKHILATNSQNKELLVNRLLKQIDELQKPQNLQQLAKLLQLNKEILDQANPSKILVVDKGVLKELGDMLQNIQNLQISIQNR